jgi:hypothetical protein
MIITSAAMLVLIGCSSGGGLQSSRHISLPPPHDRLVVEILKVRSTRNATIFTFRFINSQTRTVRVSSFLAKDLADSSIVVDIDGTSFDMGTNKTWDYLSEKYYDLPTGEHVDWEAISRRNICDSNVKSGSVAIRIRRSASEHEVMSTLFLDCDDLTPRGSMQLQVPPLQPVFPPRQLTPSNGR